MTRSPWCVAAPCYKLSMRPLVIAPSIVPADFGRLADRAQGFALARLLVHAVRR